MKRSELEKHIGKSVEVKLFDGDTMQGVLRKTGTEEVKNDPNLYLKGGYYFLSHILCGNALYGQFKRYGKGKCKLFRRCGA